MKFSFICRHALLKYVKKRTHFIYVHSPTHQILSRRIFPQWAFLVISTFKVCTWSCRYFFICWNELKAAGIYIFSKQNTLHPVVCIRSGYFHRKIGPKYALKLFYPVFCSTRSYLRRTINKHRHQHTQKNNSITVKVCQKLWLKAKKNTSQNTVLRAYLKVDWVGEVKVLRQHFFIQNLPSL